MPDLATERSGAVLLADPEDRRRHRVEQAFAEAGLLLDLVAASGLDEAARLAGSGRFGLALIESSLAGKASPLMAQMRRRPAIPFFILDPHPDPQNTRHYMEIGAADCLPLGDAWPETLARLPYLASRALQSGGCASDPSHLFSISHDLRSPLSGLLAHLHLIEQGTDGPLAPAQAARLARARESLERLTDICQQVADLALIESGRLRLVSSPIDLGEEIRRVAHQVEPLLHARAVDLRPILPADLPRAVADPGRLRQLLVALLTCALRRVEGSSIEVEASHGEPGLSIQMREVPRGLPVEALPDEFLRGADAERESDGTSHTLPGLGFRLARGLAALHGGDLRVSHEEGVGLVVRLTLPSPAAEAPSRAERSAEIRPQA